ncbi:ABC transporter permease [Streptomyces phytohabitans]|uniref:ABC transporter permease n=1 Tax=Streptomyces phytohabitans TaxID=1150371 RepID=UPI00345B7D8C
MSVSTETSAETSTDPGTAQDPGTNPDPDTAPDVTRARLAAVDAAGAAAVGREGRPSGPVLRALTLRALLAELTGALARGGVRAPLARLVRGAGRLLLGLLTRTGAVLLLLALWEVAPRAELVDPTFLPPLHQVVDAWWGLFRSGELGEHTRASLTRSGTGFGLAVLVAVPLGLLIGWYRRLADALTPLLEVFRNTAALALLPVFVLLLGIGETSKIAIVLYACAWPILLNTVSAVRTVDPTLLRLARSMDLSTPQVFRKVILPASLPTVFTGIRLSGGVAILVLVAAEMVGAKAGLGYLVNSSQFNFAIPQMYAAILTVSVIGVAFNQLLLAVERRLTAWRPETGRP